MRITVPQAVFIPPGMGWLGQDASGDSGSGVDLSAGLTYTAPTETPIVSLPSASDLANLTGNVYSTATYTTPLANISDTSILGAGTEAEQGTSLNSYITNPSLAPTGGPSTTAQILSAAGIAAAAAARGITAASGPYAVPGTSLVYNPATGQILNAAGGLVGSAALPGAFNFGAYLPLLLGVGVVWFVFSSMNRR